MSLNKVMLIGNVGRDPEVRYLDGNSASGGSKVARFTLATTERYRDRNGETRENTEWHNIVAWRNLADLSEKYIRKGSQIYVEGKINNRSWTDQSGNKRYQTEITADTIQLLGRKSDAPQDGAAQPAAPQQYQGRQQPYSQPRPSSSPAYAQPEPQYQSPAPAADMPPMDDPTDDLPF